MRKILSVTAAALVLSVGGLAVAATNPFAGAGAATAPTTTTAPKAAAPAAGKARTGILKQVLDGLVAKGTLTQAQAGAVTSGVKAKVAEARKAHPKAGNPTRRRKIARAGLAGAAKAIGVPEADLVKALKDGKSIADVATAKGVSPQKVVDALVTAGNARIDAAVKAGKIDAARATKAKARLEAVVTRAVNAKRPAR